MKKMFVLCGVFSILISCGGDNDPYGGSNKGSSSNSTVDENEFKKISSLVVKSCGGATCHTSGGPLDGIISSGANLVASRSDLLIAADKMPKPGSRQAVNFSDKDKQVILGFIKKYK